MNCPVCKSEMQERNGKFGRFFFCKKHGTLSVQGSKLVTTGDITKSLRFMQRLSTSNYHQQSVDLEFLTRIEMAKFGVLMDDLDLFVEGGQEASCDEPEHWMNERPY